MYDSFNKVFRAKDHYRHDAFELSGPPPILHPKPPACLDGPSNQQAGTREPMLSAAKASALVDPALWAGQSKIQCS
jgi:hypothetical protein